MGNKFENLTTEELRQLTKDAINRLSDRSCAELLEWAKKEFPELWDHEKQQTKGGVTA